MPNPYDLLSQKLDTPSDPDDQLRLMVGQDQGANLAGGPDADPNASTPPAQGGVGPPPGLPPSPQPVPASPNVPGPLSAMAMGQTPQAKPKPRIKLKLKSKKKPLIKLKAKSYG